VLSFGQEPPVLPVARFGLSALADVEAPAVETHLDAPVDGLYTISRCNKGQRNRRKENRRETKDTNLLVALEVASEA